MGTLRVTHAGAARVRIEQQLIRDGSSCADAVPEVLLQSSSAHQAAPHAWPLDCICGLLLAPGKIRVLCRGCDRCLGGAASRESCDVQVVATAEVVVVSLDEAYRPRRLPQRVRQLLLAGVPQDSSEGPIGWT